MHLPIILPDTLTGAPFKMSCSAVLRYNMYNCTMANSLRIVFLKNSHLWNQGLGVDLLSAHCLGREQQESARGN